MKQLVLGLVVGLVCCFLTAAAAWAVPSRHSGSGKPDLAGDPHWLNRTRPNPVHYDRVRPGTQPTTTTVTTTSAPRVLRASASQVGSPSARSTRPSPPRVNGDACGGWRPLVDDYAWNVDTACRILLCESGGNQYAVGPRTRYGRAQGLMQILPGGSFDPATNMAQAWAKYAAHGWAPWVCR